MSTENKFYDLSEDTLELIEKVLDKIAMPFNIKIKYIGNPKQKQLIKLQKCSDITTHLTNIDLIVFINEDYFIKLEELNAEILCFQEFDRLSFDLNKGVFKLENFKLQTNPGVLKKYGIDAVAEANQLSELYTQQKKDLDKEAEFDLSTTKVTKITKDVEFLS